MFWTRSYRELTRAHRDCVRGMARALGRLATVFGMHAPDRNCGWLNGRNHAPGSQIGQRAARACLAGFAKKNPERNGSHVPGDRTRGSGRAECKGKQQRQWIEWEFSGIDCLHTSNFPLPTVFNQPVQKQKWQGQQQENLLHRNDQSHSPDGKPHIGVNNKHGQQASTQHRQANRFINQWSLSHG